MKILVLPGGGVRGVLQARLLERLEEARPFLAKAEAYAGCSIGTVNAVWLALGKPVAELVPLYRKAAPYVFGSGVGSFFASAALKATLKTYLGDQQLRALDRPVLAYSVGAGGLVRAKPDETLVDVCLQATAAPPSLLPHQGQIDGGAVQTDPGAMALAAYPQASAMLSVGTGYAPAPSGGGLFAGLKAAMAAAACASQVECATRLRDAYCRVQPQLPRAIGLAEADALEELVQAADAFDLTNATWWLKRHWA